MFFKRTELVYMEDYGYDLLSLEAGLFTKLLNQCPHLRNVTLVFSEPLEAPLRSIYESNVLDTLESVKIEGKLMLRRTFRGDMHGETDRDAEESYALMELLSSTEPGLKNLELPCLLATPSWSRSDLSLPTLSLQNFTMDPPSVWSDRDKVSWDFNIGVLAGSSASLQYLSLPFNEAFSPTRNTFPSLINLQLSIMTSTLSIKSIQSILLTCPNLQTLTLEHAFQLTLFPT